jgi:hypothetical protein
LAPSPARLRGAALALSRAAARRALDRCGRVRGRLASTPCWFAPEAPSLALTSATQHIIA